MGDSNFGITASGNTYNSCLLTLREKGYRLRVETLDGERNLWCASRDDLEFAGYSPPELLGLVALWEHLGDDWNRQSPDLLSELLDTQD